MRALFSLITDITVESKCLDHFVVPLLQAFYHGPPMNK